MPCHDHGWIQIFRGRNLNYLESLHHEKEHEHSIRYRALEGALRIKPLVVTDDWRVSVGTQAGKSAHRRQMGTASGLSAG